MKKRKFNEHQIIGILKSVESGQLIRDVCREQSIADVNSGLKLIQI